MIRSSTSVALVASTALACALVLRAGAQPAAFPDAHETPPSGWTGPVFKLRQDFPSSQPSAEQLPWKSIDFRTQPGEYARAVLAYAFEGNLPVDWQVEKNTTRSWYHAPWLHAGTNGREFVHGLTRERSSRPRELHPNQTSTFQNWAVSVYNAPGGWVIGKVWKTGGAPDPAAAVFPDGTVAVKLLFTNATVAQVPYLKGAFEWDANIHRTNSSTTRAIRKVRLLQIDIAARDARADGTTGWVFGTFVYDANRTGASPWEKMVPVGVMWGNDPGVLPGQPLSETWINPDNNTPQHLGWGKRLNGPVDNVTSSCLSCHSTAQYKATSPMTAPAAFTVGQSLARYFRNVLAAVPFDAGQVSCDYSLQLAMGIQNYHAAMDPPTPAAGGRGRAAARVYKISRDELEEKPIR
jgi:hypothetical protein